MSDKQEAIDMADRILRRDELILKIPINKANLEHIASTGKINGSLYDRISNLLITEIHLANVKRSIAEKQIEAAVNERDALKRLIEEIYQLTEMEDKQAIMKDLICNYLDSFEGVFDSDEAFWSPEHMIDYLTAASWMHANFGRSTSHVRRVQEKLDQLPY